MNEARPDDAMETPRDVLVVDGPKIEAVRCKGQNGSWPYRQVDVKPLMARAHSLWNSGRFDTADIAHHLKVHESEIWKRMDAIKRGG